MKGLWKITWVEDSLAEDEPGEGTMKLWWPCQDGNMTDDSARVWTNSNSPGVWTASCEEHNYEENFDSLAKAKKALLDVPDEGEFYHEDCQWRDEPRCPGLYYTPKAGIVKVIVTIGGEIKLPDGMKWPKGRWFGPFPKDDPTKKPRFQYKTG